MNNASDETATAVNLMNVQTTKEATPKSKMDEEPLYLPGRDPGEGLFGRVYVATGVSIGVEYALKQLNVSGRKRFEILKDSFRHEVKVLSLIKHVCEFHSLLGDCSLLFTGIIS